jgi:hypothetical protein
LATTNANFKVKNGLDAVGAVTSAGLSLLSTTSPIILNGQAGTSGQVLTSAGAGATPTWTTVSGGGSGFTGAGTSITGVQSAAGVALPISTANNTTASGAITISSGTTSSGIGGITSGSVTIGTGDGAGSGNNSGAIVIATGAGSGSSGNSGSVTIDSGIKSGTGTTGTILIGTTNTSGISIGRTGITNTLTGTVNYNGASSPIHLNGSAGTSGQVLTSAGAGATPTWTTVSGGSGASLSTFNTFTQAQVIQPSDAGPALSLINAQRYLTINSYSFSTYYNGEEDVYVTTMNVTSIPGLTSGTYQIGVRSLINNYPVVAASYNNGVFTNENTTGYLTIYAAAPQIQFTPPVLSIRSGSNNAKRLEIGETGVLYLGGAEVGDPFPIQAAREGNGGYLSASYEGALNWKLGYLVDYPVVPIVTSDGRLAIASTAGTSGQVLTSAGSGSTPTWTSKGHTLISSVSFSGSAPSFTSIPGTYKKLVLEIKFTNIGSITGNLQMTVNSGATVSTTAYNTGSTTAVVQTAGATVPLSNGAPTAGDLVTVEMPNYSQTRPMMWISGSTGASAQSARWGVAATAAAITQISFTASTGSFTSATGTAILYGVN